MNLRIVSEPTGEPMSVTEAQSHLRYEIDETTENDDIRRWIRTAREACEQYLVVPLTDAIYEYRIDGLAGSTEIALPMGGVAAIDAIEYVDPDGNVQTLDPSTYVFDDNPTAPMVRLAYGQAWPQTRNESNAVRIRFHGFYSETGNPPRPVPAWAKSAMGLILGHLDANREQVVVGTGIAVTEIPYGAEWLMFPHRFGLGV